MTKPSAPITIRTSKQTVAEIDAIATATERSRNFVVNQALQQYLETNAWQLTRIREGIEAARAGRVRPAREVFENIASKHGWSE
ncbi:MAG: hypothetical protein Dbin4_01016 [Alphaproteobacteria bacterium]|nr:hypothetical protein [Alphaproteobacteria bacterium]